MKNFIEDIDEFTNGGVFSVRAKLAYNQELIRIKITSREGYGITEIIYIKYDENYSIPECVELFMMDYECLPTWFWTRTMYQYIGQFAHRKNPKTKGNFFLLAGQDSFQQLTNGGKNEHRACSRPV